MEYCKDCIYYDDETTYPNTGYCKVHDTFVDETQNCEDYEENDYE